jgi:hypothetical protein
MQLIIARFDASVLDGLAASRRVGEELAAPFLEWPSFIFALADGRPATAKPPRVWNGFPT